MLCIAAIHVWIVTSWLHFFQWSKVPLFLRRHPPSAHVKFLLFIQNTSACFSAMGLGEQNTFADYPCPDATPPPPLRNAGSVLAWVRYADQSSDWRKRDAAACHSATEVGFALPHQASPPRKLGVLDLYPSLFLVRQWVQAWEFTLCRKTSLSMGVGKVWNRLPTSIFTPLSSTLSNVN